MQISEFATDFQPTIYDFFWMARSSPAQTSGVLRPERLLLPRRLGDAVGGRAHRGVKGRGRRDVDDRAGIRGFEERRRGAGCPHRRLQVDAEALFPAFLVVGAAETRGVVDQDVETAERLAGFG